MIKEEIDELVQGYGYIDKFPEGMGPVGRSSQMVEYMVLQPKPGKKEQLRKAAARLGILLEDDKLKMSEKGKPEDVLIFRPLHQLEFADMVREVVKGRNGK